jgi:hypothetical protein
MSDAVSLERLRERVEAFAFLTELPLGNDAPPDVVHERQQDLENLYICRELIARREADEKLRAFAHTVMDWAFTGYDPDGGDIQDAAEKHGLVAKVEYDPVRHSLPEWLEGEVEPGDAYYEFTAILNEPKP